MSILISQVDSVRLSILESNPPQLLIQAQGMAATPGWTNPELILKENEPVDGILSYDFVAIPPEGPVPQVLVPIRAVTMLKEIPFGLKGVQVNSATNSLIKRLPLEQAEISASTASLTSDPLDPIFELETLLGIEVVGDKLKIRVPTGGCTSEKSFFIDFNCGFSGMSPCTLAVYRVIPDLCDGFFPDGIELEYCASDFGITPLKPFNLVNKVIYCTAL